MPTFTSHSLFDADSIKIDAMNVTYNTGGRSFFSHRSTVIARIYVASISIEARTFFADVIIESTGGQKIVAKGFRKSDAKEIMRLLSE
jgi:hypothetical protein